MLKIIMGLLLAMIVLVSGCTETTDSDNTTPTGIITGPIVDIKNFAFTPDTMTISNGTTVTWINRDRAPHTVTGKGFDSGSFSQGKTFSYTFKDTGTFDYYCTLHSYMKGKVIVT